MYLKAYDSPGGSWYLQFQESDANNELSAQTVTLMPNGYVRILSNHFGKFWWTDTSDSDQWVHADWDDSKGSETTSYFWPVKIDNTTIALRSLANGNFCKRLTVDSNLSDRLSASVSTITTEARMQVQELVSQRKVYNVTYHMQDAMIYNEAPYVGGSSTVTNYNDEEASMEVSIQYQNVISYTFSRGTSVTAGVSISIEAEIPLIEDTTIETSFSIDSTLQWDTTTTTTTSVTATGTVPVPANSTVIVSYVGTMGTCNIPYTYTQEDVSSTTGEITYYSQTDGIYNGVSCYNFVFQVEPVQPLQSA
ncbi:natterin-4-like [Salvia hispanica]|uniref:natterin-4-like n=1 Tax=Salvia hispanica TaxID=49212 RepID=UPI002009BFF6|nr:natterin-4-like [Salvia hispanica]